MAKIVEVRNSTEEYLTFVAANVENGVVQSEAAVAKFVTVHHRSYVLDHKRLHSMCHE